MPDEKRFPVLLTPALREALRKAAFHDNLSRSEWIRRAILERLDRMRAEDEGFDRLMRGE